MDVDEALGPSSSSQSRQTPRAAQNTASLKHFYLPLPSPANFPVSSSRPSARSSYSLASSSTTPSLPFTLSPVEPQAVSISNHFLEIGKDRRTVRYIGKVGSKTTNE